MKQRERNDIVGDLANDAEYDDERPTTSGIKRWRDHLSNVNACDGAKEALEDAFEEYYQYKKS